MNDGQAQRVFVRGGQLFPATEASAPNTSIGLSTFPERAEISPERAKNPDDPTAGRRSETWRLRVATPWTS